MFKKDLIQEIFRNLTKYPPAKPRKHTNKNDILDLLTLYNYRNYNIFLFERTMPDNLNSTEEISDNLINNIKNDIDDYFAKYAPNDNELKESTKYMSLYLSLIAKKPLHPIGKIGEEYEIKEENNSYFCKRKTAHIKEEGSLCKYCVCKAFK